MKTLKRLAFGALFQNDMDRVVSYFFDMMKKMDRQKNVIERLERDLALLLYRYKNYHAENAITPGISKKIFYSVLKANAEQYKKLKNKEKQRRSSF